MAKTLAFAVAALLLLPTTLRADAPVEVAERDRVLVFSRGNSVLGRLPLPEPARQILQRDSLVFVALGPAGLWVVDIAEPGRPSLVAKLAEDKDVVGVLPAEGRVVHAVVASYGLASFDLSDPKAPRALAFSPALTGTGAAASTAPAAPGTPAEIEGRILSVSRGQAIVDRGRAHGLRSGDHIKVLSQELVERPNLTTGQPERVPSNEVVAVLVVEAVDPQRASAGLHRGDRVRAGDRFVTTRDPPTERLLAPPRQDHTHRVVFLLRPFIELGTLGLGSISDLRYSYRFDFPLALEVGSSPLAFEVRRGDGPRQMPTAFDLGAAYDTDFFAVGLGAGGMVYPRDEIEQWGPNGLARVTVGETKLHFALTQMARLGYLDGLSVELRNTFVFRRDDGAAQAAFHWGSTDAHGHVPLSRRLTLSGGGGGGDNGWAYGEIGVRTYFKGTGGAGTIIVPVSLGVGGFTRGNGRAGPLVTIGLELRR